MKLDLYVERCGCDRVAPFVGAWIETPSSPKHGKSSTVAPFVGAWIETKA